MTRDDSGSTPDSHQGYFHSMQSFANKMCSLPFKISICVAVFVSIVALSVNLSFDEEQFIQLASKSSSRQMLSAGTVFDLLKQQDWKRFEQDTAYDFELNFEWNSAQWKFSMLNVIFTGRNRNNRNFGFTMKGKKPEQAELVQSLHVMHKLVVVRRAEEADADLEDQMQKMFMEKMGHNYRNPFGPYNEEGFVVSSDNQFIYCTLFLDGEKTLDWQISSGEHPLSMLFPWEDKTMTIANSAFTATVLPPSRH